ncbi:MAG: hypothetical protein AAGC93_20990 [Cyanobacteria bacterium P01_F01_bin.53]
MSSLKSDRIGLLPQCCFMRVEVASSCHRSAIGLIAVAVGNGLPFMGNIGLAQSFFLWVLHKS